MTRSRLHIPLRLRLASIREAGGRVQEIILNPLELEDVSLMMAESLHSQHVRPLARLVHEKTAGNPFFAIQFVTALADEGLLAFDRDAAPGVGISGGYAPRTTPITSSTSCWASCASCPPRTCAVLQQLACLGSAAPAATLALVQSETEDAVHATLRPAVRARLLLRQEGVYRFLHDRVREAAYALIPESERAAVHLAIGRRLAAQIPPSAVEESVFEIVGQLNRGSALISAGKERERLAELNLIAGRRAKSSTAYSSALSYLTAGSALLPANAWEHRHDLAFALELHRAECEFLTSALADAEPRLSDLAGRASTPSEMASVTRLRVDLFMTLGRSDRAVEVGLDCLRRFGIDWSAHPTTKDLEEEYAELWRQLGDRPIEELLDLPRMSDPVVCAAIDVLTFLVTPALFTDEKLRCLVIGRMGNLNLKHGNSEGACYVYTALGNVLEPLLRRL